MSASSRCHGSDRWAEKRRNLHGNRSGMTKMTMTVPTLPAAFADLKPFVVTWWQHETQPQSYLQRQTSRLEDLQIFYDLLSPRIQSTIALMDHFNVEQTLPP